MDDIRSMDRRIDKLQSLLDSLIESSSDCMISFVGKTKTITTYPTVAKSHYAIIRQTITGNETEGTAPTFADDATQTGDCFAINIGANIPPVGTYIRVDQEPGGKFEFNY